MNPDGIIGAFRALPVGGVMRLRRSSDVIVIRRWPDGVHVSTRWSDAPDVVEQATFLTSPCEMVARDGDLHIYATDASWAVRLASVLDAEAEP